jgi:pimeloyl-ACP methyl ester carboxylesterase
MASLTHGEFDVALNGVNIHYTVRGQGPIVLAHSGGPGFDARGWDDFAGIDQFLTLVVIHPRGSGLSADSADGAYALADFAADLEALRLHLKLDQPAVMGWSHGGMVAQKFAARYPQSLSRLVLVDTAALLGSFVDDIEAAVKRFSAEPWFEASYLALKKEWAGDFRSDEDMALLWNEEIKFYFATYDERAAAYHRRTRTLPVRIKSLLKFNDEEVPNMDLRSDLRQVMVPSLIIVGRHDFITNVAMAAEMKRCLANARLEILEHSGHFPFIEEPDEFRRIMREFFEIEPGKTARRRRSRTEGLAR